MLLKVKRKGRGSASKKASTLPVAISSAIPLLGRLGFVNRDSLGTNLGLNRYQIEEIELDRKRMHSYKVKRRISVHGSIPHHEPKFNHLKSLESFRPEASKGERDFLRGRQKRELVKRKGIYFSSPINHA
jgi:hypothetical protein